MQVERLVKIFRAGPQDKTPEERQAAILRAEKKELLEAAAKTLSELIKYIVDGSSGEVVGFRYFSPRKTENDKREWYLNYGERIDISRTRRDRLTTVSVKFASNGSLLYGVDPADAIETLDPLHDEIIPDPKSYYGPDIVEAEACLARWVWRASPRHATALANEMQRKCATAAPPSVEGQVRIQDA